MIFLFNVLAHWYQNQRKNDLKEAKQIGHLNPSISLTVHTTGCLALYLINNLNTFSIQTQEYFWVIQRSQGYWSVGKKRQRFFVILECVGES